MIKDIIVSLSIAPTRDVAANFAGSIAATFEAHVAGIAFVYEPLPPAISMGRLPPDVLDDLHREKERAAKDTVAKFEGLASRTGLSFESRMADTSFADAAHLFGRIARRFDLSVVGQGEPDGLGPEELVAEAALFESGRPVVVVPYIQKDGLKLDRVMVCWDGSHPAARAMADAMPFLKRAGTIQVVTVTNDPGKGEEISGVDIAHHLARHGLNANSTRS
jgi:hypothetical protein